MPAKDQRVEGSTRERVRTFLAANPQPHRPVEIGEGTGLTTHQAATAAYALAVAGEAERGKRPPANVTGRPHNTYAITALGAAVARGETVGGQAHADA